MGGVGFLSPLVPTLGPWRSLASVAVCVWACGYVMYLVSLCIVCHCRTFSVCPFPRVTCLYVYDCLCVLRLHAWPLQPYTSCLGEGQLTLVSPLFCGMSLGLLMYVYVFLCVPKVLCAPCNGDHLAMSRSFNYRSPHYWQANPQGLCVCLFKSAYNRIRFFPHCG